MAGEQSASAEDTVSGSFAFVLGKLGLYATQRFGEQIAPLGLRPRHCGVLALLQRDDAAQLSIATSLDVSNSVVVNMLDELEELGAVRRIRETDRRRHRVELTDRGRDLAARAGRIAYQLDRELLAPLDAGQAAALRAAMDTLAVRHGVPGGTPRTTHGDL